MKYASMVFIVLFFSVLAAAQTASGTPAAAPAAASGLGGFIAWIVAHQGALGGFVVGVLDLLFALNPNTQAPDGILHAIYKFAMSLKGKDTSVPPTIGGTPSA